MKLPMLLTFFFVFSGPLLSGEEKPPTRVVEVSVLEANKLLSEKGSPVVIDIRTPSEFYKGHLEGALIFDFQNKDFRKKLASLDRSKSYLFYCKSGGRSTKALTIWRELGFEKVYHLKDGFLGWKKQGGRVVR